MLNRKTLLALAIAGSYPLLVSAAEEPLVLDTVQARSTSGELETETNSGALGNMSVLDTPFSVTVVSADDINDRQVSSLGDLFARDASAYATSAGYGSFGTTLSVRGLPLNYSNSYKLNGMPVRTFNGELPYDVFGQVELLKGLSGFMYGFGAPGGIVNYVTKKPTDDFTLSADIGYRSGSILKEHLDVSDRLNSGLGYRINAAHENGDTIWEDGSVDRDTLSAALDYAITPTLTLSVNAIYDNNAVDGVGTWMNVGLAEDDALPEPVKGTRNLSVDGAVTTTRNEIYSTGLDWRFADRWSARLDLAQSKEHTHFMMVMPTLTNSAGDLSLRIYDQKFYGDFASAQLMIQGAFDTGSIAHELVTGLSYEDETTYRMGVSRRYVAGIGSDNLYSDNDSLSYHSQISGKPLKAWNTRQTGVFASDTITFDEQWSVIAGLRYNEVDYFIGGTWGDEAYGTASKNDYSKDALTPTLAIRFKPAASTTLYASYVESLEQGGTVSDSSFYNYVNAGEKLDPVVSKQLETGIKTEQQGWTASAALFRINRTSSYDEIVGVDGSGATQRRQVQDGEAVYHGLELAAAAAVSEPLAVSGSLTFMDASYDKMGGTSTIEGNDVMGTADLQAALEARYIVPGFPLQLTAGAKYTGTTTLDDDNNWTLPSYTLLDAGAVYTHQLQDHQLEVRAVVNNLTDKEYWSTNGEGGLVIGEARTFAVNLKMDW